MAAGNRERVVVLLTVEERKLLKRLALEGNTTMSDLVGEWVRERAAAAGITVRAAAPAAPE